jgi:predicted polyphosphate/ATP-dependent NAD kinase
MVSGPTIGIVANPASARDIRRIVTNASNLQIADRVNILLRLLSSARACGVARALVMPDKSGIRALLTRHLQREQHLQQAHHAFPEVEFLDMEPTTTVEDTFTATRLLHRAGVSAIVVLGGDGTHRAVVRELSLLRARVPIAGLSTGTNNAFPEMREPTITGIAVGLYATGCLGDSEALSANKLLEVAIDNGQTVQRDIALVDAVISSERVVGARALWKPESLAAAYVSFADPQAIGLSAIAGLLQPVGRYEPGGLAVTLCDDPERQRTRVAAPIAPGLVRPIGVAQWTPMRADEPHAVAQEAGVIALDGERELPFADSDDVTVTLRENAFFTVDVARCMQVAAREGLLQLCP